MEELRWQNLMDWTRSFVRDESTIKAFDEYPSPPSLSLSQRYSRFEYEAGKYGVPVAHLSGIQAAAEIIETTAGRALTRVWEGIADEPGHERTMWATPVEEPNCVLVFIRMGPSLQLSSPTTGIGKA